MDRTGIIVVTICAILLGVWFVESQKYASHLAQQRPLNTNAIATAQAPATNPIPVSTITTAPGFSLATNLPEKFITLTNSLARYTFTSRGGGLEKIELLDYPETVSPRWKKEMATNAVATLNARASAPVLAILGDPSFVGDGDFTLTKIPGGVHAEKDLDGLVLSKDFILSSNYLVNATVSLKNDSGKPLSLPVQEWVVGTATPMAPDDRMFSYYGGAMWFNGANSQPVTLSYFNPSTTFLFFFSRTPKTEFRAGNGNVIWAEAHNQFFTLLAMPKTNQPAEQIVARPVSLPPLTFDNQIPTTPPMGIQTALIYPALTLTANQVFQRQIVFYAGPKEFRTLEKITDEFQNRADLVMNFGTGFAGFWGIGSFFAKILLSLMNWLHDLLPKISYGWVIVLLTILLRACFWPLTAASTRSMKKMQALAPEVKALKEKYKDDPQKFTQKQMELWRKNKVSPMSGCLPAVVQMPVFLGFYTMLRSAIELRGAPFLWVTDLTKPDTLFLIPGFNFPINLLPLLMVGAMIWQAHLQPTSPGMDPNQQKMMRYMPLAFLLFFYNYASGMALYMTVSTLVGILQTRLMKKITVAPATATTVSALTPTPKRKK